MVSPAAAIRRSPSLHDRPGLFFVHASPSGRFSCMWPATFNYSAGETLSTTASAWFSAYRFRETPRSGWNLTEAHCGVDSGRAERDAGPVARGANHALPRRTSLLQREAVRGHERHGARRCASPREARCTGSGSGESVVEDDGDRGTRSRVKSASQLRLSNRAPRLSCLAC